MLSFEGELDKLDVQPQVREFLRYLFVVDYHKRPTAMDVLNSPQFHLLDQELTEAIPALLGPPSPEKLISFM
jgi:hypothetical protein